MPTGEKKSCCDHCSLRKRKNSKRPESAFSLSNADSSPQQVRDICKQLLVTVHFQTEFDRYSIRRRSIPFFNEKIELELDHNFYNLIIITIGLLLCGVITGVSFLLCDDPKEPSEEHNEQVNRGRVLPGQPKEFYFQPSF